jgi:hypothetical protein
MFNHTNPPKLYIPINRTKFNLPKINIKRLQADKSPSLLAFMVSVLIVICYSFSRFSFHIVSKEPTTPALYCPQT